MINVFGFMINDESSLDEIIEHIGIVIPPDRTYEPYYKVNNKKKESDKANGDCP